MEMENEEKHLKKPAVPCALQHFVDTMLVATTVFTCFS